MKLWSVLLIFTLSGCVTGQAVYHNASEPLRNPYEIIAPMRVMSKVTDNPRASTIDHLLMEARKIHGPDVDIKNLSKDIVTVEGGTWELYNFYVVRYNRFD
jgi:hypothetical protein